VECVACGGVTATIFSGLAAIDNNDGDGILESSHIPRVCHLAVNDEGEAVEGVCATSWQTTRCRPQHHLQRHEHRLFKTICGKI